MKEPVEKKKVVGLACESCRKMKVKCDGEMPCQRCQKHGLLCMYTSKKKRPVAHDHDNPVLTVNKKENVLIATHVMNNFIEIHLSSFAGNLGMMTSG